MSDTKKDEMRKIIDVKKGDIRKGVNDFLANLLEDNKVAAVIAPMRVPSGEIVFPAMVSDPAKLAADPFAPVLPVSTAQMVSRLTRDGAVGSPVAVIMRNCQIRAFTELIKLKQVEPENLIIIGIDCPGTYSIGDYKTLVKEKDPTELYTLLLSNDKEAQQRMRNACRACREPIPENCDLVIGVYGMDVEKGLLLDAITDMGKSLLEGIDMKDAGDCSTREERIAEIKKSQETAEKQFNEEHENITGIEEILKFYSTCINCQNCRRVCPICYCRECFFVSDNLAQSSDMLVNKSRTHGAFKMPMNTILFHLGRMNHMILSCVECGLCEQACPVDISLMQVLKRVASNAQSKFDYKAGRSLDEEVPLAVFKEEEFTDVGEK